MIIAKVESVDTPMIVNSVLRSFCGSGGRAAEIAAAADAPQIAVAPPVSRPHPASKAHSPREPDRCQDGQGARRNDQRDRFPAERNDLLQRDPEPEHGDA